MMIWSSCTWMFMLLCGLAMSWAVAGHTQTPTPVPTPAPYHRTHFYGCNTAETQELPYCDFSKSYEERAEWVVSNLSLVEAIQTIAPNNSLGDSCAGHVAGVERLGISQWSWLTEANSCILGACVEDNVCPTTFPGGLGVTASFNRTLWQLKGWVLGQEERALMNLGWHRGDPQDFVTLSGFGPNINIARDPRFGRTSELSSEDPFLAGMYAAHQVRGMQTPDSRGRPLMLAYLKHYTAYSLEKGRGHDNHNISAQDMFETYLAQYEIAFKEGKASGVMCSYAAENGFPSCANGFLLNDVMRDRWGQPDVLVATDCGAVQNLRGAPVNASTDAEAAAYALMNGTDIELGSTLFLTALYEAVQLGLATEERVKQAVYRFLLQHMRAGRFDADTPDNTWRQLGKATLNSSIHQQINREAGEQSLVLLRNYNYMLPLDLHRADSIAVIGPQAVTRGGLLPDYSGNDRNGNTCMTDGVPTYDCVVTIAEAIAWHNQGATTTSAQGVDVNSNRTDGIAEALQLAQEADIVVLALGIDKTIEHEGVDRTDTALPGLQEPFAKQVLALNKPTILILTNGGQLAIDSLLAAPPAGPGAIIEAFNPSLTGALGIARHLFGEINEWGKLPYTLYPHKYIQEQPMLNYDMSLSPGRTYKYYEGVPLYPFGFGLSYTDFEISNCRDNQHGGPAEEHGHNSAAPRGIRELPDTLTCEVKNSGDMAGVAVILLFHSAGSDVRKAAGHPIPFSQLRAFERIRLVPQESREVVLNVGGARAFELVNAQGNLTLYEGTHYLEVSLGNSDKHALEIDIVKEYTVKSS